VDLYVPLKRLIIVSGCAAFHLTSHLTLTDAGVTSCLQAATYLCPAVFPWVDMGPATEESGMVVLKLVGVFYVLIIVFDVLLVFVSSESSTFVYVMLYTLLAAVTVIIGAISRKPQNK